MAYINIAEIYIHILYIDIKYIPVLFLKIIYNTTVDQKEKDREGPIFIVRFHI